MQPTSELLLSLEQLHPVPWALGVPLHCPSDSQPWPVPHPIACTRSPQGQGRTTTSCATPLHPTPGCHSSTRSSPVRARATSTCPLRRRHRHPRRPPVSQESRQGPLVPVRRPQGPLAASACADEEREKERQQERQEERQVGTRQRVFAHGQRRSATAAARSSIGAR